MTNQMANGADYRPDFTAFSHQVEAVSREITAMLIDKNRKYGNSALNPIRLFSKSDALEQINVRLDDKLSRLQQARPGEDEDVELDLIGYLFLRRIARGQQS